MCTGAAAPGQRSTSARTFLFKKRLPRRHRDTKKNQAAGCFGALLPLGLRGGFWLLPKVVDSPKASNDSALDYSVPSALLWLRCAHMDLTVLNVGKIAGIARNRTGSEDNSG